MSNRVQIHCTVLHLKHCIIYKHLQLHLFVCLQLPPRPREDEDEEEDEPMGIVYLANIPEGEGEGRQPTPSTSTATPKPASRSRLRGALGKRGQSSDIAEVLSTFLRESRAKDSDLQQRVSNI